MELLVVTAIMGILALATAGLLASSLRAQQQVGSRLALEREGLLAMERMTDAARRCTFLLVPNAGDFAHTVRPMLAVSGFTNDDGDFYFGDPLFPRIDEDVSGDMSADGRSGIKDINDDGDNQTDEGFAVDDDEDGQTDEDPVNGLDDDGDGNLDEDSGVDMDANGKAGLQGIDDDGDGNVDEGFVTDDDEDGLINEDKHNALIFGYTPSTRKLWEQRSPAAVPVDLSTHVQNFSVEYHAPQLITITLVLSEGTEVLTLVEKVCIRNALQSAGKRVR